MRGASCLNNTLVQRLRQLSEQLPDYAAIAPYWPQLGADILIDQGRFERLCFLSTIAHIRDIGGRIDNSHDFVHGNYLPALQHEHKAYQLAIGMKYLYQASNKKKEPHQHCRRILGPLESLQAECGDRWEDWGDRFLGSQGRPVRFHNYSAAGIVEPSVVLWRQHLRAQSEGDPRQFIYLLLWLIKSRNASGPTALRMRAGLSWGAIRGALLAYESGGLEAACEHAPRQTLGARQRPVADVLVADYLLEVGRRIRERREDVGLTQTDLATLLGYKVDRGAPAISRIEAGDWCTDVHVLVETARFLELPLAVLLPRLREVWTVEDNQ